MDPRMVAGYGVSPRSAKDCAIFTASKCKHEGAAGRFYECSPFRSEDIDEQRHLGPGPCREETDEPRSQSQSTCLAVVNVVVLMQNINGLSRPR